MARIAAASVGVSIDAVKSHISSPIEGHGEARGSGALKREKMESSLCFRANPNAGLGDPTGLSPSDERMDQ